MIVGDTLDLDRYCERIGYTGPHTPTIDTLHAITAAHAQAVPFENLNPWLGWPVRLETGALFQKLVIDRRGGYCFEQNGLLLAVLTQLGFTVRPISARVRVGTTDRSIALPRTHLVLEVSVDGALWLTDVGVGAASLTHALRLEADTVQTTPHDERRLVRVDGLWYHQVCRGGVWSDVYEFTGEGMPLIDRTVANWYTSTHPDSKFRHALFAAMAQPGGRRITLHNRHFAEYARNGTATTRELTDDEAITDTLQTRFGIRLPAGTRLDVPSDAA